MGRGSLIKRSRPITIWLIAKGARRRDVNYIIIRPKFLHVTITPRIALVMGASTVLAAMCILGVLALSLLWRQHTATDEKASAVRAGERVAALLGAFESGGGGGGALSLAKEAGSTMASLIDAAASIVIDTDLKYYGEVARRAALGAEVLLARPHRWETEVVAAAVAAAAGPLVKALSGDSSFQQQQTTIVPNAAEILSRALLPALKPLRRANASATAAAASKPQYAYSPFLDAEVEWDFVVKNLTSNAMISEGASHCAMRSQTLRTRGIIAAGRDVCGYDVNSCVNYNSIADASSSSFSAVSTATGSINAGGACVRQGGTASNALGLCVTLDAPLPLSAPGALPSSSAVALPLRGPTIAAHVPQLGITVCFFKPLGALRAQVAKTTGQQFKRLFGDEHSTQMRLTTNIMRLRQSNVGGGGSITHLKLPVETALGTYYPINSVGSGSNSSSSSQPSGTAQYLATTPCRDPFGCENGAIRSIVRATVSRCLAANTSLNAVPLTIDAASASTSASLFVPNSASAIGGVRRTSEDPPTAFTVASFSPPAAGSCTAVPPLSTGEGVDNSTTAVRCAAAPYGMPLLIDTAIVVCRPAADRDEEVVAGIVSDVNAVNAIRRIAMGDNGGRRAAEQIEYVVATRNPATNAVTPQATAFGRPAAECLGPCGRAADVTRAAATAVLSSGPSGAPTFTGIIPDYRPAAVAAHYEKLTSVGRFATSGLSKVVSGGQSSSSLSPLITATAARPIAAVGAELDLLAHRRTLLPAALGLVRAINAASSHTDVVPLTNKPRGSYEPTRRFDGSQRCGGGVACIDRVGRGIVYRSDCPDCLSIPSSSSAGSSAHQQLLLLTPMPPQCDFSQPQTEASALALLAGGRASEGIGRSGSSNSGSISPTAVPIQGTPCGAIASALAARDGTDYGRPFSGPLLTAAVGESLRKQSSYDTALAVPALDIGIIAHSYGQERRDRVNKGILTGALVSAAAVLAGVLVFVAFSQNNLKTVEAEWNRYRRAIAKQKADFAKIVGDVVPPAYANLLFLPNSSIAERLNITVVFVNIVAYQKIIADQPPEFLHDHVSYAFFALNCVTKFYRMFKVKTFGDNYMLVGGVNRQLASRSAAIRKRYAALADEDVADSIDAAAGRQNHRHHQFGADVDDDEDLSIARCVEASAVMMQLFSHMFVHNPTRVGFLRRRVQTQTLSDLGMVRIGIANGPTNLIMTRHDGFPYFLALSEAAACAYKLQQQAKSCNIFVSADVRRALVRAGRADLFVFGQEKTVTHKKIVFSASPIQQANVPIPLPIIEMLRLSRAPNRLYFTDDGKLSPIGLPIGASGGGGTMTAAPTEKGSFFRR